MVWYLKKGDDYMDDITFNKEMRQLNKAYCDMFGVVPCIQEFDCSREDYIEALKKAVSTKTEIEKLLHKVGVPLDSNAIV